MSKIKKVTITFLKDKNKKHQLIVILLAVLLIAFSRNRFDHGEYIRQWKFFLDGGNPWDYSTNSYGPLHNLIAFFYSVNSKLPRLIFSLCAIFSSFYLYNKIEKNRNINSSTRKKLMYLLYYNPLIWIFFVINGCNDGLVACLFLFGIVLYDKNKFVTSALLLSLAILYKYIPLFIIPFLCINNKRINWRFSLSTLFFLGVGFGLTFLMWGDKFLTSILFNSGRESKILSIFRHFRGDYSMLKIVGIENLDFLSTYLVVGSVILIFIVHIVYNLNYLNSLILAMLSIFLFYKVGHFQFYISIYFLLIYFILKNIEVLKFQIKLNRYIFIFLYWIAGTTLFYGITEGFYKRFHIIRDFIGIPHFIILTILTITLFIFTLNNEPGKDNNFQLQ